MKLRFSARVKKTAITMQFIGIIMLLWHKAWFQLKSHYFHENSVFSEIPRFLGILAKNALFQHRGTSKPLKRHCNSCLFHPVAREASILPEFRTFPRKSEIFMKKLLSHEKCGYFHTNATFRIPVWKRQLLPCPFNGFEVPFSWKSAILARIPRKSWNSTRNSVFREKSP